MSERSKDPDSMLAEEEPLDSTILYEIRTALYTESVVSCVDTIKENHPDIPKRKIIKAVRDIHEEGKR